MNFAEFSERYWAFNQEVLELGPEEAIRLAEAGQMEHLRKTYEVDQYVASIEADTGIRVDREAALEAILETDRELGI